MDNTNNQQSGLVTFSYGPSYIQLDKPVTLLVDENGKPRPTMLNLSAAEGEVSREIFTVTGEWVTVTPAFPFAPHPDTPWTIA